MIDVKQAIRAAKENLLGLYDDTEIKDVLLEEVELSEDGKVWNITLGFSVPEPTRVTYVEGGGLSTAMRNAFRQYERKYKLFRVNGDDGMVMSMKIREV